MRPAADSRRRSQVSPDETPRLRPVECHAIQLRESVRAAGGIQDFGRTVVACRWREAGAEHREAVMGQALHARVGRFLIRRRETCLVVAPELAERFAVDAGEDARRRERHTPRRRLGERRKAVGPEPVGEILRETRRRTRTAARPSGQSVSPPLARSSGSSAPRARRLGRRSRESRRHAAAPRR